MTDTRNSTKQDMIDLANEYLREKNALHRQVIRLQEELKKKEHETFAHLREHWKKKDSCLICGSLRTPETEAERDKWQQVAEEKHGVHAADAFAHHSQEPDETLRKEFEKLHGEKLGATGEYPEGKLNEQDEGEIKMGVTRTDDDKVLRIDFGKPVAWLGLRKEQVVDLILLLSKHREAMKE